MILLIVNTFDMRKIKVVDEIPRKISNFELGGMIKGLSLAIVYNDGLLFGFGSDKSKIKRAYDKVCEHFTVKEGMDFDSIKAKAHEAFHKNRGSSERESWAMRDALEGCFDKIEDDTIYYKRAVHSRGV